MKLLLVLSLTALCSALSLPSIFSSSSSSSTQSTPYNRARDDYNRQDGQWIWVPNSALRDIANNNGYNSGSSYGYNSNGYNNNGVGSGISNNGYNSAYSNGYNSNGYNNRLTTSTYSSIFG